MSKLPKTSANIARGSIVLVPFPFTDLTSIKVRPALVVSSENKGKADVIVLFISSIAKKINPQEDILLSINDADFEKSGLKMTSIIKCRKVATLDRSIILGELGTLSPRTMKHVDGMLKKILGI